MECVHGSVAWMWFIGEDGLLIVLRPGCGFIGVDGVCSWWCGLDMVHWWRWNINCTAAWMWFIGVDGVCSWWCGLDVVY